MNSVKNNKTKKPYDPTKYIRGEALIKKPELDKDKNVYTYKDFVEKSRSDSIITPTPNNNPGGYGNTQGGGFGNKGGNEGFNLPVNNFSNEGLSAPTNKPGFGDLSNIQNKNSDSNFVGNEIENKSKFFEVDKSIHNPYEMIESNTMNNHSHMNKYMNNISSNMQGQQINQSMMNSNQYTPINPSTLKGVVNNVNMSHMNNMNNNMSQMNNMNNNMSQMNNINNNMSKMNINQSQINSGINYMNNMSQNNFNQFQNQFSNPTYNQNQGQSMVNNNPNLMQSQFNNTNTPNKMFPNQSDLYSYNNYPPKN